MIESLFNKVAGLKACKFIKKRPQHRCFHVNIVKFLRTPSLKNICDRVLLFNVTRRLSNLLLNFVLAPDFFLYLFHWLKIKMCWMNDLLTENAVLNFLYSVFYLFQAEYPEAVVRRCFVKNIFKNISQNSSESTCAWVSFWT